MSNYICSRVCPICFPQRRWRVGQAGDQAGIQAGVQVGILQAGILQAGILQAGIQTGLIVIMIGGRSGTGGRRIHVGFLATVAVGGIGKSVPPRGCG